MKRTVSAALVAIFCLIVLTGCSTMKTTWRSTRKLYRQYVNVDPTIDLTDQGISDKGLQRLAALFMPVDERLMEMSRALGCQDTKPENEWCQQLLASYPWLSGIAVVDASGVVRYQVPATSLRPLDFTPLLEFADRYKVRKLGTVVKSDEFGTVVMVGAPFFENNEWAGLVVAFFDPRNLLHFSPEPDALAVVSSDGTPWPGGSGQAESMVGIKWADILKSNVQGEMSVGSGKWVWVSRYLGQLQVIYMTDAQAARAKKPEPQKAPPASPSAEQPAPAGPGAPVAP